MLRCSNNECRQKSKNSFTVIGDRIKVDGFFRKLLVRIRDERDKYNVIYDNEEYYFKVTKVGETFTIKLTNKEFKNIFGRFDIVCDECGHKDTVAMFIKAYENPMSVFDTENLCDCGGEIWTDFEAVKSEDQVKEDWQDDDYQRKVKMSVKTVVRCERCGKEYPQQLL